ncbi:hypothetical protein GCM10010401_08090 [Rarobacter faecitabidus]
MEKDVLTGDRRGNGNDDVAIANTFLCVEGLRPACARAQALNTGSIRGGGYRAYRPLRWTATPGMRIRMLRSKRSSQRLRQQQRRRNRAASEPGS